MPLLHPSMMPNHSVLPRQRFDPIFSIWLVLVVLGLSTLSAADGDLDPAFVPDTGFPDKALGLGVIEGKYYFSHSSRNGRLLEEGQLDPDWSLEYAGMRIISEIWQTPSGGLVFNDLGRVLLQTDQATPHDIGYARSAGTDSRLVFPQADGWIVIGPLLSRVSEEGDKDPAYGSRLSYEAASFNDGAGKGIVGGPSVSMIQDELNRFIVAGNIKQIGDTVRLGLARLLPNGQLDLDWDVASALGIELSEDNYLNALPISLASGPMNQLVVGLQLISGTVIDPFPPAETRRLVRIPPDSDARLLIEMNDDAGLSVHIATQPGKAYLIRSRTSLGAAPTLLGVMIGDGYGQEFRIEANGAALFIDFQAELIEP